MIHYGRQIINKNDIKAVVKTLRSDYLTTGPKILEFEEKFAAYIGAKYAVAVSSGTAALHIACLSAGIESGDELITSPMTFAASSNCAFYCGAKPIFVDIKEENGLIDEGLIEAEISPKTKIIIPVHYAGLPCNMEKIKKIANKHSLIIIEDACHALEAEYGDTRIGDCAYSSMAIFSFHPVKHITTGEGGMITTNSEKLYQKLLLFRSHGITKGPDKLLSKNEGPWFYEMQELGFNYRITDFQCALGISQLKKADAFLEKRRKIANKYTIAFSAIDEIEILKESEDAKRAYHLYVIKVKDKKIRLRLFNYLKKNDIFCQVHYIPVHWHPYYQKLGYKKGDCPKTGEFYEKIISLPIYPGLKSKEQEKVIRVIKNFYAR
jgi:UDP-4-amino-4,6-dideoxy-N-acetyl-beta-L-altrosamine transaminase